MCGADRTLASLGGWGLLKVQVLGECHQLS